MRPLLAFICALAWVCMVAPVGNAQGQGASFFYSGGKKNVLTPSTRWDVVQLDSAASATSVETQLRATSTYDKALSPVFHSKKHVLIVPLKAGTSAGTRTAFASWFKKVKGVKRMLRAFGNGTKPIVETDELVVQFKPGITPDAMQALLKKYGAVTIRGMLGTPNGFVARVADPAATTATAVANALYESGQALYSHPNFIWPKQPRFVPNDPLYAKQWHLNNSGQLGGTSGADIKAPAAWDITRGSSSITIALIDDGLDVAHEDFQGGKLVAGKDILENDDDPSAEGTGFYADNHGTACAGIAAANGNNGIGVSGIAPNCKLMPIRLIGDATTTDEEHDAFEWAWQHGADIISCSWGPPDNLPASEQVLPDNVGQAIQDAVTYGRGGKGCVIFFATAEAAAGHGTRVADIDGYSSNSNVISVAASTLYDTHADYSDYGSSVDIAAPGDYITTTDRTGEVGYSSDNYTSDFFSGTSAACPLAAGVGALVLSLNPSLTRYQVQQILQNSADKVGGVTYDSLGHNDQLGYGRINAFRALQAATPIYTITGKVTLANGTGVAGAEVSIARTGGIAITAADGTYTLQTSAGTSAVAARKTGYYFTPASQTVTVSGNTSGINFTATPFITTLVAPATGASVSGITPLRATTNNDAIVQRVEFARRSPPVSFSRNPNLLIPDATVNSDFYTVPSVVSDSQVLSAPGLADTASISVNITHPYSGDLLIKLIPPSGSPIVLRNREGGGTPNVVQTYQNVALGGIAISGTWTLQVSDTDVGGGAAPYTGTLVSWGMAISPLWTTIATDTDGTSGGQWTGSWDTTATAAGTYEVRARAVTAGDTYEAINTGVTVGTVGGSIAGPSGVMMSQGTASTNGAVTLRFTGGLTSATATAIANYAVTVNGLTRQVTGASLAVNGTVTLQLTPAPALGNAVIVRWANLRDQRGRLLLPGQAAIIVK